MRRAAHDEAMGAEQSVEVGGHTLRVSNLDKVLYPVTGTTKADVLRYLLDVAPYLLPHTAGRPATRKRWPHGVGTDRDLGESFFVKALEPSAPSWIVRGDLEHSGGAKTYPLIDNAATLAWLGQVAALEIHVPQWRLDLAGRPSPPDRMVLDLDPGPGTGLAECAEVARLIRPLLQGMGLDAVPVTSGSKGIHLYSILPSAGSHSSEQIREVAHELARSLEADHPDLVVSDMKKSLRKNKVLVDWSQNSASKTTVAPYSLRGRARPTVAAPRTWEELEDDHLTHIELGEVLARIEEHGDPLDALAPADLLATYREKRDAKRTPEPVPGHSNSRGAAAADDSVDGVFVIHEHHASRLHWDLRLEHRGVLRSWALPKGIPTSQKNALAVQTEDHPMEYLDFSGTIPRGEYGAGEMSVWDTGTYRTRTWHEGHEVSVILTGQDDGGLAASGAGSSTTLALIRTGGEDEAGQWLAHLMQGGRSSRSRPASARSGGQKKRSALPEPMLATAGAAGDLAGAQWSLEMKWDGMRAIVGIDGEDLRIASRSGHDMTDTYPELAGVPAIVREASSVVLDGELVALDERGRASFALLQQRIQAGSRREIAQLAEQIPVQLAVFDILEADGQSCMRKTYEKRRELLAAVIDPEAHEAVSVPAPVADELDEALAESRRRGYEGIVAKRHGSRYASGRRSRAWLKITHSRTQEAVVIGWRPGRGARSGAVGSLLLAVPSTGGGLRYAGRVGTGFRQDELQDWVAQLERIARKTAPVPDVPADVARDAHWVTPRRVAEVQFASWTEQGRMRHPRWRGWRHDKGPADLDTPQ